MQRNTGLDTKASIAVNKHPIFILSLASGSISIDDGAGIVMHRIAIRIISIRKCNHRRIACGSKYILDRYHRKSCDHGKQHSCGLPKHSFKFHTFPPDFDN